MESLFSRYDRLVILDTETTGLNFQTDEIIEFACAVVESQNGEAVITEEYDELIQLSPGKRLDPYITKLTGISEADLRAEGIEKAQLCNDIARMFAGNTLIVAYNAHFDLSFLFYLLYRGGKIDCLRGKQKLDLLTVYKDRRDYPHKLKDAIVAYDLSGKVVNSHRAIDDVKATVEVMKQMCLECDDLLQYIDLFGYNPKFGVTGKKISSVRYLPQGFDRRKKLYE